MNDTKFKIELTPETVEMIAREMESIPEKYQKPFNSTHEGYAVILEEVRELEQGVFFGEKKCKAEVSVMKIDKSLSQDEWSVLVKENHKKRMRDECIQIAAMCARFIQELT